MPGNELVAFPAQTTVVELVEVLVILIFSFILLPNPLFKGILSALPSKLQVSVSPPASVKITDTSSIPETSSVVYTSPLVLFFI